MGTNARIAILGTDNIGRAMAVGLAGVGRFQPSEIILTRRSVDGLADLAAQGFQVQTNNRDAARRADVVVVAVQPGQLDTLLHEIAPDLDPARHLLVSVVSGASIADIVRQVGREVPVVRAMPNTAIAVSRSMTCLATNSPRHEVLDTAASIFDAVGTTMVIDEEHMIPATALCACGIAFFLRAVRAASQGGSKSAFTRSRRSRWRPRPPWGLPRWCSTAGATPRARSTQ